MTGRARELLLEVLLLSERYSEREIEWVRRKLSQYPNADHIGELLRPFQTAKHGEDREPARLKQDEGDPTELASAFLAQLASARSAREHRRVDGVAKRLAISALAKTHEELIEAIRRSLQKMPHDELLKFIRNYKISTGPDDSYVGLAQYLIRDRRND